MKPYFYYVIAFFAFVVFGCTNGARKDAYSDKDKPIQEISLHPTGDTNFVSLRFSNICLRIKYSENKPKEVKVSNCFGGDSLISHYSRANQGVYFVLSSIAPNSISAVGFRYLKDDTGSDIEINLADGSMKTITNWSHYGNEGRLFEINSKAIKSYVIKDGQRTDSVLYLKKEW